MIDYTPHRFSSEQYQLLAHMGEMVVRELESGSLLRWRQLELEAARTGMKRLVRGLECFKGACVGACGERGEGGLIF